MFSVSPPEGGKYPDISPPALQIRGGNIPIFPPQPFRSGGEIVPDLGGSPPVGGKKGSLDRLPVPTFVRKTKVEQ